jgi:tetratricopeptide (TPR) repeat protein
MRTFCSITVLIRRILPLAAMMLLAPQGLAMAQADTCGVERNAGSRALDEFDWKQLNAIHEKVSGHQLDEAFGDLQRMQDRAGRDSYLRAILNQALAQVEWSRGNYTQSLSYYEKAVELDVLPDPAHFALMYQIAQLYYLQDRYDQALEKLELWFCKSPPEDVTSAAYVLQASIFAQKEDYAGALTAIETAIAMEQEPTESWYQLKLAAQYELQQYASAAKTLEAMITFWPAEKDYWGQLSRIYFNLENHDRALAVQALAWRKGLLDRQSELLYLSSLYSHSSVPYKAAEVLQMGIESGVVESSQHHWTIVAESWYAAEEMENSLFAWEQAGSLAAEGGIDLRRAYILVDLERWQEAGEALDRALGKDGLDESEAAEAYLLRGLTRFELGQFDDARSDWSKAARYEKTREAARQWQNHLEEERRRRAS